MPEKYFRTGDSAKSGFTLVEMLIVIVIIVILALIALGNFGDARKRAQVDLAADSVISGIKQQQGKARSGRVEVDDNGNDEGLKCYGLVLSVDPLDSVGLDGNAGGEGASSKYVQYVETPYYKVFPGQNKADYCDMAKNSRVMKPFDGDLNLQVYEVLKGGNTVKQIVVLFKPPFGKVVYYDGLSSVEPSTVMGDLKVGVTMENIYNSEEDVDYIKYLYFKYATGGAGRIYE